MLKDFKELGLKNKRLEDDLKGKGGRPSERVKLMEDNRKELQEVQKEAEEQQKLTNYWKKQIQKLRGKMAEERQTWESKYKIDIGKQSQEITELKLKLRAEKIGRTELQSENQSIRNALHAMELSLVEHKNYIIELREKNIYHNVQYERALGEVERDKDVWEAQGLARQLYIQHTIKQIYKAIHKAHDMLEKAEALYQEVIPIGKNG